MYLKITRFNLIYFEGNKIILQKQFFWHVNYFIIEYIFQNVLMDAYRIIDDFIFVVSLKTLN